jgi:acetyl esterase/lipase
VFEDDVRALSTLSTVAALAVVALPAAADAAAKRLATTVAKPPGKAPLRYRDEVFRSVRVTRDVMYADGLALDVYAPAGDRAKARPAVVWIHGGGFRAGSKGQPNIAELATASARRGYVALSIDYRLVAPSPCGGPSTPTGACVTAALAAREDAQNAVRWLRANAKRLRVDPHRVAIGGTSAGAVTALLLATSPADPATRVQAAVAISGEVPGVQADRDDAPSLFFEGTEDHTVPYAVSRATAQAMAAVGVPVVFEALQGAGHVPWQYRARFEKHSAYFLYEHLGLGRANR